MPPTGVIYLGVDGNCVGNQAKFIREPLHFANRLMQSFPGKFCQHVINGICQFCIHEFRCSTCCEQTLRHCITDIVLRPYVTLGDALVTVIEVRRMHSHVHANGLDSKQLDPAYRRWMCYTLQHRTVTSTPTALIRSS